MSDHPGPPGARWSVSIRRIGDRDPFVETGSSEVLATASIGKILLLITAADQLERGMLAPDAALDRRDTLAVADSGQWQHLATQRLGLADACALVGATSDNLATNALIDVLGLDAVGATAESLGLRHTALLDYVRDVRTPDHPVALSVGCAEELERTCRALSLRDGVSDEVASRVIGWLSTNTDLSMVASAFGLDPLAHASADRGVLLWNKTGTNVGVRCDIGVVAAGGTQISYAVLANWTPSSEADPERDQVLSAMAAYGHQIRSALVADR